MSVSQDCQVLYIGKNHETYRGVNDALRALGLTVMWAQDAESAEMLAKTTRMEVMVCDKALRFGGQKLFRPNVLRPGTSYVEMALPRPDPTGRLFERNIERTRRLIRVVRSLPGIQTEQGSTITPG